MRRTKFRHVLLILLMIGNAPLGVASPGPHPPFEASGVVIHNHDGDTIKLETRERGVLNVRFSGADTPETGQAYWKVARDFLKSRVEGKQTTVWCYKLDRYEREVCHVRGGQQDLGQALIESGHAWYAFQYAAELSEAQRQAYSEGEQRARERRVGLWQESDPMPPWECRKLRRAGQKCR